MRLGSLNWDLWDRVCTPAYRAVDMEVRNKSWRLSGNHVLSITTEIDNELKRLFP